MKKIILIFAILIASCKERATVVIDGCEYIETENFNGEGVNTSLTHKGNCKNPIHHYVTPDVKNDTIVLPLISGPLILDTLIKK